MRAPTRFQMTDSDVEIALQIRQNGKDTAYAHCGNLSSKTNDQKGLWYRTANDSQTQPQDSATAVFLQNSTVFPSLSTDTSPPLAVPHTSCGLHSSPSGLAKNPDQTMKRICSSSSVTFSDSLTLPPLSFEDEYSIQRQLMSNPYLEKTANPYNLAEEYRDNVGLFTPPPQHISPLPNSKMQERGRPHGILHRRGKALGEGLLNESKSRSSKGVQAQCSNQHPLVYPSYQQKANGGDCLKKNMFDLMPDLCGLEGQSVKCQKYSNESKLPGFELSFEEPDLKDAQTNSPGAEFWAHVLQQHVEAVERYLNSHPGFNHKRVKKSNSAEAKDWIAEHPSTSFIPVAHECNVPPCFDELQRSCETVSPTASPLTSMAQSSLSASALPGGSQPCLPNSVSNPNNYFSRSWKIPRNDSGYLESVVRKAMSSPPQNKHQSTVKQSDCGGYPDKAARTVDDSLLSFLAADFPHLNALLSNDRRLSPM